LVNAVVPSACLYACDRTGCEFLLLCAVGHRQIRYLFVHTARCAPAQYRQHSMLWDSATKAVSKATSFLSFFKDLTIAISADYRLQYFDAVVWVTGWSSGQ